MEYNLKRPLLLGHGLYFQEELIFLPIFFQRYNQVVK